MNYKVSTYCIAKIKQWLAEKRGVAVWSVKDLGSPGIGQHCFTPARDAQGQGNPVAPHWKYGNRPDDIVEDAARFEYEVVKEVKRVRVRRGLPYNGGVHKADLGKLHEALAQAGPHSFYVFDYMDARPPYFAAVVQIVESTHPITDYVEPSNQEIAK